MKKYSILLLLLLALTVSCKKDKTYLYQVATENVSQPGTNKPNVKEIFEFISIAYSDIFGQTISAQELSDLATAYESFGDLKLIEDLIIRNFLQRSPNAIPTVAIMQADVSAFVISSYKKLLNRQPNEFELWFMTDLINSDPNVTPELLYYAVLTSNEYRQY